MPMPLPMPHADAHVHADERLSALLTYLTPRVPFAKPYNAHCSWFALGSLLVGGWFVMMVIVIVICDL